MKALGHLRTLGVTLPMALLLLVLAAVFVVKRPGLAAVLVLLAAGLGFLWSRRASPVVQGLGAAAVVAACVVLGLQAWNAAVRARGQAEVESAAAASNALRDEALRRAGVTGERVDGPSRAPWRDQYLRLPQEELARFAAAYAALAEPHLGAMRAGSEPRVLGDLVCTTLLSLALHGRGTELERVYGLSSASWEAAGIDRALTGEIARLPHADALRTCAKFLGRQDRRLPAAIDRRRCRMAAPPRR